MSQPDGPLDFAGRLAELRQALATLEAQAESLARVEALEQQVAWLSAVLGTPHQGLPPLAQQVEALAARLSALEN